MKTAIQEMEELCILREAREIFRVLGRISYQNLLIFWSKYERRSLITLITFLSGACARAHVSL